MNKKSVLLRGTVLCVLLQTYTYCYAIRSDVIDSESCVSIDKLSYEQGKGWSVADSNWTIESQNSTTTGLSQNDTVITTVSPVFPIILHFRTEGTVTCDYKDHTVVLTRKYFVNDRSNYIVGRNNDGVLGWDSNWIGWNSSTTCSTQASSLANCAYNFYEVEE